MTECEVILEQAWGLYRKGTRDYRDCLLEVGRLLHEFVLAHLENGNGMTLGKRCRRGFTRRRAVAIAAEKLGTTQFSINRIIGTRMAVELLGTGDVGNLTPRAIRCFCVFIRRKRGTRHSDYGAGIRISDHEQWEVKPEYAKAAKALFSQAVAKDWRVQSIAAEVRKLLKPNAWSRRKPAPAIAARTVHPADDVGDDPDDPVCSDLVKQARAACPGDVAEMCMDLVRACDEPLAAATRLRTMLDRFIPKSKLTA